MSVYAPEGVNIACQRNLDHISTVEGLIKAKDKGSILEAEAVLCDHELNLHVALPCGIKAIIPRDEAVYSEFGEATKDIAILTRVGKPVCFKVLNIKQRNGTTTAILSRRAAQEECIQNYISTLVPGDIVRARVTHLEVFGAFVDIGCGIISLLSIDSISVSRINHPKERLSVQDDIYGVVKSRDELGRINISMRELLGTWSENANKFEEGQTVGGIVRGVESYGIFIELTPNLAGLAEHKENIRSGERATVYIKSIIPEKMKVKLIIIETQSSIVSRGGLTYYFDPDETYHIDSWTYSPSNCKRLVSSNF